MIKFERTRTHFFPTFSLPSSSSLLRGWGGGGWVFSLSKQKRIPWTGLKFWWTTRKDSLITLHVLFFYFGGARSKGFPTLKNVPKLLFSEHDSARFTIRVFDVEKPDWVRNISRSLRVLSVSIGTLISNNATAMRTSLKKWICVLSVYIIPTHLLCQMQANPPGVEFLGTISKCCRSEGGSCSRCLEISSSCLGCWLMVNKISNQTVHHQSATKFASMLQDIKKITSMQNC